MNFNRLQLDSRLMKGIEDKGYKEMTEVQEQTLDKSLGGWDVAVQSQTGTGKTAAFLITLLERLSRSRAPVRDKALVLVPTRELAVQVEKEARLLNRHLGFSIGSVYGGVGYGKQEASLRKGLDIIIGTPGRILDFSQKKLLRLRTIRMLVIDEADRLFDMGFLPDLKKIIRLMPPRNSRQTMLFSATLNRTARAVAAEYMNRPEHISVCPEELTVKAVQQQLFHVKSHIKMNLMLGILKAESPKNALIFSNTRHAAYRLSKSLKANGFRAEHLTGDLPQSRRLRIIDDFKSGKLAYLVATDVAARGIHVDDLEMVINYDIPEHSENYVHRIGRTARAGKKGKAITLASENTLNHLDAIESLIGEPIPVQIPGAELFETDHSFTGYGKERRFNGRKRFKHA